MSSEKNPSIFVSEPLSSKADEAARQWASNSSSQQLSAEPKVQRRRSLLGVLKHGGRSRSTDTTTRTPVEEDDLLAPPAYEAVPKRSWFTSAKHESSLQKPMRKQSLENALEVLRDYDTVILMDDSSSMQSFGSKKSVITRWEEAGLALAALAETVQTYDEDGMDIHFLNHKGKALNMTSAEKVQDLFNSVTPNGQTLTGKCLDKLLKAYLTKLEGADIDAEGTPRDKETNEAIKPVNFIVITDGESTDDPKSVIVAAGVRLKAMRNLPLTQLGIQFVQVGDDSTATKALKNLDDELEKEGIPDIVDTTPYSKLNPLTSDGLIKVLLGGINRRVDNEVGKKKRRWTSF
ncbi:hypothetical protein C8R46DRAFT_1105909 [Mycena filopes]|nr:hypothetical protein C8R46DRAFT_1105909 [Mycena filopes]